jgi:hypothetical protein
VRIFLQRHPHFLAVRGRAEGPGGLTGDLHLQLRPGETFLGWTYAQLAELGDGGHDLEPKDEAEAAR